MARRGKQERRWRRRLLAVGVAASLHLALFGVLASDWAKHRQPPEAPIVSVTLKFTPREESAPKPPTPSPKPAQIVASASAPLVVRPVLAEAAAPAPLPAIEGVADPLARPGGALDLRCMTPNLPKRLRDECDRGRLVARLERPDPKLKGLEPRNPPDSRAAKPLKPGIHFGLPFGVAVVVDPEDKGFPPGLGKTKTTVFDPEKVDRLPPPMK